MKILIKNGHIVDAKAKLNGVFDIFVERENKRNRNETGRTGCDVIDAKGCTFCLASWTPTAT